MGIRAGSCRRGALVAGVLMTMSATVPPTATAQAVDPLASRQSRCNPQADLRCWYLVGAIGEAPERVAFIARNAGALSGGKRRIDYIQVVEQAGHAKRFYMWDLEVDCKAGSFRVLRLRDGNNDGTVVDATVVNDHWQTFSAGRFGESSAQPLACTDGPPPADSTLFIGNAYRAPDMMHQFRSVFWR